MASAIFCSLSCPHCNRTIEARFTGPRTNCPFCGGTIQKPIFPALDNAANQIHAGNVIPYSAYTRVSLDKRRKFFTVQGIESIEVILKIKSILEFCFEKGADLRDFERKVRRAFGKTLAIPEVALEKVFRGTINRAYTDGLLQTVDHPLVSSGFPYLEFSAVHDDRTPATHLALEQCGLDGTPVYRRDDPFWRRFMPPLTDLCRCTVIQLTLRMAAEKGVREAREWLRTGDPPRRPGWVERPSFDPRLDLEDEWPEADESAEESEEELEPARNWHSESNRSAANKSLQM